MKFELAILVRDEKDLASGHKRIKEWDIADLTNYKDTSNVIVCRVYQLV